MQFLFVLAIKKSLLVMLTGFSVVILAIPLLF
ncbi:hypothetical protein HD_0193 [[Haemophilus] ducreyi 35000HP]|uniref:Uncharacterized protein n=1 Tax=Haemophilus ducreyi (strain 35000HP / ATCC 700724) TaxID=233412 RepID=Q7VP99_HAEDU|nr:hypothetical protein HD_0193 [[Haemophilus] ducreyi 35000HP]